MGYPIYVDINASNIELAIVASRTSNPQPKALFNAVVGDQREIDLYFIDNGNFATGSGDATYTPRIGIGSPGAVPSGGTFTLSDGSVITSALDFDATAAEVQTALNALNSGAGPFSDTVTVTSTHTGYYIVRFDSAGAQSALTASSTNLTPSSGISISEVTTGDGSTNERQSIRLTSQPAVLLEDWTIIQIDGTDAGFRGTLSFNNNRVHEQLAGAASIDLKAEIELEDPSGNKRTYGQSTMTIFNEIVDPASFPADDFPLLLTASNGIRYLEGITGYTGGASTDLDSIATLNVTAPQFVFFDHATDEEVFYRLIAGTASEASPNVILPDDYNASTNAKYWQSFL